MPFHSKEARVKLGVSPWALELPNNKNAQI